MQKVEPNELGIESGAVDFVEPETEGTVPATTSDTLWAIEGVEGIGLGGVRKLCVYVTDGNVRRKLPKRIDGFDIDVRVTGRIRAHAGTGTKAPRRFHGVE